MAKLILEGSEKEIDLFFKKNKFYFKAKKIAVKNYTEQIENKEYKQKFENKELKTSYGNKSKQ